MINQKSLDNLKPKPKTKKKVNLTLLPETINFLKGITGKNKMSSQIDDIVFKIRTGHLLTERKIEMIERIISDLKREDPPLEEIISILKKILPTG